jgi:hypothetical protein
MTGTEIVTVDPGDVLLPVDADTARQAMTAYQQVTSAILEADDWQGSPNRKGSFVKKSGWRKIAKAYRLSTELVNLTVDYDPETGLPIRSRATVRAIAPNGQAMDGTGACSIHEPRFATGRGRYKLENDLPATAETRAKNRAISDLTGFGQLSAEEAEAGSTNELEYGPAMNHVEAQGLDRALDALYHDREAATTLTTRLAEDAGGYIPSRVARALMLTAAHRPDPRKEAEQETGTGVDEPPTNHTP